MLFYLFGEYGEIPGNGLTASSGIPGILLRRMSFIKSGPGQQGKIRQEFYTQPPEQEPYERRKPVRKTLLLLKGSGTAFTRLYKTLTGSGFSGILTEKRR